MIIPVKLRRGLRLAVSSLWHRKLRSFLTILGIVFGVSSVIAMLAIGEGAGFEAQERIRQLGSRNIILNSVKPPADAGRAASLGPGRMAAAEKYGLLNSDLRRLRVLPTVALAVPVWRTRETVWRGERRLSSRVVATTPDYLATTNLAVLEGRFFNESDARERRHAAVIGAALAQYLFPMGDALGRTVRVKRHYYRIIGILGERVLTGRGEEVIAEDVNFDLYLPLTTARSHFGEFITQIEAGGMVREWVELHQVILALAAEEDVVPTVGHVSAILRHTHRRPDYEITVPLELLKQAEQTKRLFNIVLGSIAAISLLVGGVGIMNIMLASVLERTREIGIRRALGARKRDITVQFLIESCILSAVGGVIGVILGVLIPLLVSHFAGMHTIVTLWSLGLAFSISVGIGIVFGLYPARSAAELDPITALHHE